MFEETFNGCLIEPGKKDQAVKGNKHTCMSENFAFIFLFLVKKITSGATYNQIKIQIMLRMKSCAKQVFSCKAFLLTQFDALIVIRLECSPEEEKSSSHFLLTLPQIIL